MRLRVLGHHSEPTDPELIAWLLDAIDSAPWVTPTVLLVAIIVAVVAIPALLAYFARRGRGLRG